MFAKTEQAPIVQAIAKRIKPVCEQYPIYRVWLYGSCARGDFTSTSDADFIVEMLPGNSLGLGLSSLERDLEIALGIPVDVATLVPLRSTKLFMDNYLKDRKLVYERSPR